jgi:UDP-N-acetylglucosamine transferase subunit ALG13
MSFTTDDRPLVFVSIGTDHHRFDRLLAMIATWARAHPEVAVLAQTGHTPPPDGLDAVAFMAPEDVAAAFGRAAAVVCHGGPSTIMEARAAGHVPVVVARDPGLGEHVDAHQMRFVTQIAGHGTVAAVQEADALADALGHALETGPVGNAGEPRPEVGATIERISALLDGLVEGHRRARAGKAS